jgi:hypothetical protein
MNLPCRRIFLCNDSFPVPDYSTFLCFFFLTENLEIRAVVSEVQKNLKSLCIYFTLYQRAYLPNLPTTTYVDMVPLSPEPQMVLIGHEQVEVGLSLG